MAPPSLPANPPAYSEITKDQEAAQFNQPPVTYLPAVPPAPLVGAPPVQYVVPVRVHFIS